MIKCKTCEQIYKKGKRLAEKNAPDKNKLTPFPSSDWTLIGGGKDLQDAYEKNIYYPGMGVLSFRKGKGQIKVTGWKDRNTPEITTPKPRQYSLEVFKSELATEMTGQGGLIPGFWNWMHVPAQKEGSQKMNEAKGNVVIL